MWPIHIHTFTNIYLLMSTYRARGKDIISMLTTIADVYHGNIHSSKQANAIQLHSNSDYSEVRKAYLSIIRYCHPDKVHPNIPNFPRVKLEAAKVFACLSDAFAIYKSRQSIV